MENNEPLSMDDDFYEWHAKYLKYHTQTFFIEGGFYIPDMPNELKKCLFSEEYIPKHPYTIYEGYDEERINSEYASTIHEYGEDACESIHSTFNLDDFIFILKIPDLLLSHRDRRFYNERIDYLCIFNESLNSQRRKHDDLLLSEFCRCDNSKNYINAVAKYIIQGYEDYKRKWLCSNAKYSNFYSILLNQYRKIMIHIMDEYNPHLKESIYNKLRYLVRLKDETKSFKLQGKKTVHTINKLELHFKRLIEHKFIDETTNISDFRDLFDDKNMKTLINWTDDITSLYTFIKLLLKNKKIEDTKNKHWKITAACFTHKGKILDHNHFPKLRETQNQSKRKVLEQFVSIL